MHLPSTEKIKVTAPVIDRKTNGPPGENFELDNPYQLGG